MIQADLFGDDRCPDCHHAAHYHAEGVQSESTGPDSSTEVPIVMCLVDGCRCVRAAWSLPPLAQTSCLRCGGLGYLSAWVWSREVRRGCPGCGI